MKTINEILQTEGTMESIQEELFENCTIPKGTHMEIYCNPDGLDNEDSSNGFSLFLLADKDISYYDIINNSDLLEGCSLKDNEVRIDIIREDDSFNRLKECTFGMISNYI